MNSTPETRNTPFGVTMSDNASDNTAPTFRARSDSLDIFTMSPLGSPFLDTDVSAPDPTSPNLRLPDPPILDLNASFPMPNDRLEAIQGSPSPPSTPTSPTSFAFSSRLRTRYGETSYPIEGIYGSVSGGTSYGTGITSFIGSWEPSEGDTQAAEAWERKGKGKDAQCESLSQHSSLDITPELAPEKGKGKGKDFETESSSPHDEPFEFDFDFRQEGNFDLGLRTSQEHVDGLQAPVVRLSPGSGHLQSIEGSAGPSSRDVTELSSADPPQRPPMPTLLSTPLTSHDEHPYPRHRRSFSSLSLRSIRSSSTRSMASIRSVSIGMRARVKSIAPAAKKLKGGIRKIFKRKRAILGADLTSADDDDGDSSDEDDEEPHEPRTASEERSHSYQVEHALDEPSDSGQAPKPESTVEASSDSHTTVTLTVASGTVHVPEGVPEERLVLGAKPRSMSSPLPLTGTANHEQEADHAQVVEVEVKVEMAVTQELPNRFNDMLPREVQLAVLKTLVSTYETDHARAERDEDGMMAWTVRTAARSRWTGREKGVRELVKFTRVSKTWQSLAFDGQLWDALHLASSPPHLSPALLLRLAEHAGSFVRSIDLRGWTHLNPVTLRALVRSLSPIATLDTSPDSALTSDFTSLPRFPPTNLTHISLRTCTSLTAHSLHHVLLRAPVLRAVDLRGLSAVTNTTCGVLAAYCSKLEMVNLGGCGNMDGEGLKELVGGGLDRSWTSADGGFLLARYNMVVEAQILDRPSSRLRVLRASGLKRVDEDVLEALGRGAPDLEVLDLSGARDLTDGAVEAFVGWDDCWEDTSLDPVCRRKIELSAREMGRDPATDFGPFYKRVTRLRHLSLSSCPLLTDMACTHLAHCVPRLEFLELAGIGAELKDEGLVRLLGTTPLIRRLDLEDACDITDVVLDALTPGPPIETRRQGVQIPPSLQPGHALEHLVLSYATSITNDALLALVRSCDRLKILECDNTRISGIVVKEFVKLARQRQFRTAELVTVDCRAITEALIKDLASSGQTRARKGYRHYEARTLGYVDARDDENLGALGILGGVDVNDCDEMRVAVKSFWSWQAVDAIRQAREKRRKLALTARRNTDGGVLGEALRRSGLLTEDDGEFFGADGAGPSTRPRWLTHWSRSGSGSSSPAAVGFANEDERGCIMM